MARRDFDAANKGGGPIFRGYGRHRLISIRLANGDPLDEVQREAEIGLEFARDMDVGAAIDILRTQLQLIRTLRGLTPAFGRFDGADFNEARFERYLGHSQPSAVGFSYWIRKLQARFFAGDFLSALAAASNARPLLWASPSCVEAAEYQFYGALAHAALCDLADPMERTRHVEALGEHYRQLQMLAERSTEHIEDHAALVGAETARVAARVLDAMSLYERAIRSAQARGFVQNEALASELAARFHAARGFETAAFGYLRNARDCYLRWGAEGKARQLDAIHPRLGTDELGPARTGTREASREHLDLATVLRVLQAVSSEIVLEKLLETLVRTAIEQAGAERGLLILSRHDEQRIVAEATTEADSVNVRLSNEPLSAAKLPQSVLHYVLRTQESIVLDHVAARSLCATDPYIHQRRVRSLVCLPLLHQAKTIGILFLENRLAPGVFTPARIAVLRLLASQAAISLENSRLYRDLAEREAKIRRLVDANVIGIVIWDLDGRLLDANDEFLRMVQYDREDLKAGLRWLDMTPLEWQRVHALEELDELKATGIMQAREKEYVRKDGSRVPVLIGAAAFEGQPNQGVAYILDLTERKRAEAQARDNERRYREVQMQLAHANRVATMGQLSAWIAHDVKQPLGGVVTNGNTGVRCLAADPPDLETARRAFQRIVRDGLRAAEILDRVRALTKKAPLEKRQVDLNEIILETIALVHAEAQENGISLRPELASSLPSVVGDRIQLQQVILNLVINAIEAIAGASAQLREVTVVSSREATRVAVAVCDSGPGLQEESLNRLFDAFYTTKPRGMGMGLAISRSIIESHDGQLAAGPNEPCGAVFRFHLPIGGSDGRDGQENEVVATLRRACSFPAAEPAKSQRLD